jgi:hypothetical protein
VEVKAMFLPGTESCPSSSKLATLTAGICQDPMDTTRGYYRILVSNDAVQQDFRAIRNSSSLLRTTGSSNG